MIWGWFKHIAFIVHVISIFITSAPPQIIILEVGDPYFRGHVPFHHLKDFLTSQMKENTHNHSPFLDAEIHDSPFWRLAFACRGFSQWLTR